MLRLTEINGESEEGQSEGGKERELEQDTQG